ncbi:MAG TPA: hypothetical protein VE093_34375 [Polyangiaceae bacterium]|jgi:hypothetical protein|nr:hypothetical protein [Polyangiaceae bacterium]
MPSKQVVDRQKSAQAVIAAGETNASLIAAELEKLLTPHLRKTEKIPDVDLLIDLVARYLGTSTDAMIAADEKNLLELAGDDAARNDRDEAAAALYAAVGDLREWVTALFGTAALRALGFSGPTPQEPVALSRFAGEVISALTSPKLPKPKRPGVKWDPADTVAELKAARETLDLAGVAPEAREAQGTLAAKNTAIAEYDERFARTAGFYAGLFRLAGQADLADRVRPSPRRAGQIEDADEPLSGPRASSPPAATS